MPVIPDAKLLHYIYEQLSIELVAAGYVRLIGREGGTNRRCTRWIRDDNALDIYQVIDNQDDTVVTWNTHQNPARCMLGQAIDKRALAHHAPDFPWHLVMSKWMQSIQ
jgi:hypothetical protein